MSLVTVQVEIDHGKLTPSDPHLLPETGRGLLTVLNVASADHAATYAVATAADGLPVIRASEGVIAAQVREIEALGA